MLAPLLLLPVLAEGAAHPTPEFEVLYHEQPLDHFGFSSNGTLRQRYLLSTEHWQPGGPVLFYAGNEGSVYDFSNATGLMWELAPKLGAMVVFAEERYYGDSVPSGGGWEYLSTQQVLGDHSALVAHLRASRGAERSAVIAVGGSYGGMLAAYLRYQFSHLVDGALAASAPVAGFDPGGVYAVTSKDFHSEGCGDDILSAFRALWALGDTPQGREALSDAFSTCKPLTPRDMQPFVGFLQKQLFVLAELDYPTPSGFLSTELPAHPVSVAC
eukprot:Hpha_TRINITY_DN7121_c0_g1::TRINITY_DN7121_c0_g1_i1::g.29855::m.29855/K01285/PRCP; lysosomal Pro-X carboxypeptidase